MYKKKCYICTRYIADYGKECSTIKSDNKQYQRIEENDIA